MLVIPEYSCPPAFADTIFDMKISSSARERKKIRRWLEVAGPRQDRRQLALPYQHRLLAEPGPGVHPLIKARLPTK